MKGTSMAPGIVEVLMIREGVVQKRLDKEQYGKLGKKYWENELKLAEKMLALASDPVWVATVLEESA